MTKVMRYENGKAIAGQVDAPFKVDWSDWINMTDAQKKGKKWLIENVPGAEGEIDAELFTPLWTNPSPSSAFAEQYVTLSSSDYDVLLIIARHGANLDRGVSVTIPKGMGASLCVGGPGSDNKPALFLRPVMYVSDTQLHFYNNIFTTSTGQASENSGLIPTVIYGIKKTVKIKFDALAKDVSTLASKCMMSDGETSVEDELNDSGWISLVEVTNYSVWYRKVGHIASVKLNIKAGAVGTNWTTFGKLPSGYRPTLDVAYCAIYSTSDTCNIYVSSAGDVQAMGSLAHAISSSTMFFID